jgi:sugar lactone lactonase YvrE/mono/diheme cytochrome c family protein
MKARQTAPRRRVCIVLGLLLGAALGASPAAAQTGILSGQVTADDGAVVAFRVKARDTVHRVSYTVYTVDGAYRIYNLPPSTYEVSVVEEGFDTAVREVEVTAGETVTADLSLSSTGAVASQGAGARGASAQRNYGGGAGDDRAVELVDFDTLYPPHPARDVMLRACFGCHGPAGFHRRGRRNEAGWRAAVDRMFDPNGRVADMAAGVPQVTYDLVSPEQKEEIIQYLAANFGPGSTQRDLELDPLVRDEEALGDAVYVQYELNRGPRRELSNGVTPRGSIHSVFASLADPGVIWVSGNGSNAILKVDTRELDFEQRTTEYWIENPDNINVTPHGIIEYRGKVYWVELTGDHFGELDPATGEMTRYQMPTTGAGPHSVWVDSRGNFWYTYFASAGKIARFNLATKEFTEWEPLEGFSGYGILVDRQDRVWAVGLHTPAVFMYNQETSEWTSYATTHPARRPAIDSRGKIWSAHYFGNVISRVDPVTGAVTEFELPLKDGNPYDLWPDEEDNLWVENAIYNSLVRFDPEQEVFTYYPFPELRAHTPKLDRDGDGTLWFTLRNQSGPGIAAFKPRGNVPADQGVDE